MFDKISPVLHILILALLILVSLIAIYLLYKIWKIDREELKEYQDLVQIVKDANKGGFDACHRCEHDPRVKKGILFTQDNSLKSYYSVHAYVLFNLFGFY